MEFRFEIDLRRVAMFSHALFILQENDVQKKLKRFHFRNRYHDNRLVYCNTLADETVEKIDPGSLPTHLYVKLIVVVKDVTHKLNEWYNYVESSMASIHHSKELIYDALLKDVYWTSYGTVDRAKIFKDSWLKMSNVDLSKMYIMACHYCFKEIIDELWKKMKLGRCFNISDQELCKKEEFYLVAYWNKVRENKLEDFKRHCIFNRYCMIKVYDVNESVEVNMLRLSAREGYFHAVKYFWSKLSEKEKNECVGNSFMLALKSYCYKQRLKKQDEFAEIILFLFKFLSEELMSEIFLEEQMGSSQSQENYKYFKVMFTVCIKSWPWVYFFKPLLNFTQPLLNAEVYESLIYDLTSRISGKNDIFRSLIHHIWNRIPSQLKSSAVDDCYLSELLENWDISILKLMLKDRDMIDKLNDFIKNLEFDLVCILKENQFEKLFHFIDEILIPLDLDQKIQVIVKSIYHLILKGGMNSVETLLDILPGDEIKIIKEIINPDISCYYFILEEEFKLADKFLNWKFNDVRDVEKFKKEFKKSNFTKSYIYSMLKADEEAPDSSKQNCLIKDKLDIVEKFLSWFNLSEEAVQMFRNTDVVKKYLIEYSEWDIK